MRQWHRNIEVFCFILISLFTFHWLLFTVVNAADLQGTVERIQKSYSTIRDMKGVFSQTSYLKDLDRTEYYSGEFYLKRPLRLRWRYDSPRDEEVMISGNDIWIYRRSEKQVMKSSFSQDSYSQAPLVILDNLDNLEAGFDITFIDDNNLELIPKKGTGVLEKLSLKAGYGDFPVTSFTIVDVYGNSNVIVLKDISVNTGLEEGLFQFVMPPGAELFDFSRQGS
jgi:outer membrane lipoprotein carrier protein